MKDGRITFQGSFDEIARDEPELYTRWQSDVIAATDSELELSGLSGEESTREERETLLRQVSMITTSGDNVVLESKSFSKSTFSFEGKICVS